VVRRKVWAGLFTHGGAVDAGWGTNSSSRHSFVRRTTGWMHPPYPKPTDALGVVSFLMRSCHQDIWIASHCRRLSQVDTPYQLIGPSFSISPEFLQKELTRSSHGDIMQSINALRLMVIDTCTKAVSRIQKRRKFSRTGNRRGYGPIHCFRAEPR